MSAAEDPRGERNNNPLNLEDFGIKWDGMIFPSDGKYIRFITPEKGIRAGARDLHTKVCHHGLTTLAEIVNIFAPRTENNVAAYLADLSKSLGVSPSASLLGPEVDVRAPSGLEALVTAFIHHECGRVIYSEELIGQAVVDALCDNAIRS